VCTELLCLQSLRRFNPPSPPHHHQSHFGVPRESATHRLQQRPSILCLGPSALLDLSCKGSCFSRGEVRMCGHDLTMAKCRNKRKTVELLLVVCIASGS
jgi:hypothetical protein